MLPFSREDFFEVFSRYNAAIWPVQAVAILLGIAAAGLALWRGPKSRVAVSGILALMWLWTGVAYHVLQFARINTLAYGFGALFIVQGLLFTYAAAREERLVFGYRAGLPAWAGLALIAYAGVAYPLIGRWLEGGFDSLPLFGVTPCPVTLFTFGLLLLTRTRVPLYLMIIPVIWSLIGGSAAFLLGVVQDWPLLVSGVLTMMMLIWRDRPVRA